MKKKPMPTEIAEAIRTTMKDVKLNQWTSITLAGGTRVQAITQDQVAKVRCAHCQRTIHAEREAINFFYKGMTAALTLCSEPDGCVAPTAEGDPDVLTLFRAIPQPRMLPDPKRDGNVAFATVEIVRIDAKKSKTGQLYRMKDGKRETFYLYEWERDEMNAILRTIESVSRRYVQSQEAVALALATLDALRSKLAEFRPDAGELVEYAKKTPSIELRKLVATKDVRNA